MKGRLLRTALTFLIVCVVTVFTSVFTVVAYDRLAAPKVTVPYTFSPGTTISASQVNDNFAALEEAINEFTPVTIQWSNQGSATISAGAWDDVTSGNCPTGSHAISCDCNTNGGNCYLTDSFVVDGGTTCRCWYKNTGGSSASIYAKAACIK
jgi:hypothetical protein